MRIEDEKKLKNRLNLKKKGNQKSHTQIKQIR